MRSSASTNSQTASPTRSSHDVRPRARWWIGPQWLVEKFCPNLPSEYRLREPEARGAPAVILTAQSDLARTRETLGRVLKVAWVQRLDKATREITIETDQAICTFRPDGRFKSSWWPASPRPKSC
jgi:hypothetical protein